jgi:two-component system chemotaxis sensor kinase CheA
MAGDEMDLAKYKDLYLTESYAQVAVMEEGVAALRDCSADTEVLSSMGRAAHTLKGMSATMGYKELARLAGALERLMDTSRLRSLAGTPEFGDLLAESTETLRLLLQQVVEGSASEVELDSLLRRMERLA